MKLIKLECPSCKAGLEIDGTREYVYCQYCGSKIYVDKEIEQHQVTYIYRDEARLKELEIQERERQKKEEAANAEAKRQKEEQEARNKAFTTVFIIGVIVSILTGIFWYDGTKEYIITGVVTIIVLLLGPIPIQGQKSSIMQHNIYFDWN